MTVVIYGKYKVRGETYMKAKKFLALIFAGAACITLAACDAETHTHTFSDKWSFDENEHWHEATCDDTDEVKDRARTHTKTEYAPCAARNSPLF